MGKWISVKDGLPETSRTVLAWDKYEKKCIFMAYHKTHSEDFAYWAWGGYMPGKSTISHWMDLPKPPKG